MPYKVPNYSNSSIFNRFRYWLIAKLAGKSAIGINLHAMPADRWGSPFACHNFNHGFFMKNCHADKATFAPNDGKHGTPVKAEVNNEYS